MPTREFFDGDGDRWTVWETVPTRGHGLYGELANGWLTFQSESGDRRRLAPVPAEWAAFSDAALCRACERARRGRPTGGNTDTDDRPGVAGR